MSNFELYYWPVPFRGQFIRGLLAHGGCTWDEHDAGAIEEIMGRYLGERLQLLPPGAEGRALTAKIVNDANDVIDELTLDGGREMWTPEKWEAFVPRLQEWIRIFEDTGARHGLTGDSGFMLGTETPGVADVVTAILWTTVADRFPVIRRIIEDTSPVIWAYSSRMKETAPLAALSRRAFADYGDAYCGGQIEKSLRKVAG